MKLDGQQIKTCREQKGLTQKELAEQTQLNTRTIQRIENGKTQARAFTLNRIAEVLNISIDELADNKSGKTLWSKFFKVLGLICINFGIVFVFGYLVMDSFANFNSLFGAILLSIIMPVVIYYFTQPMSSEERLVKFGVGLWLYILAFVILHRYHVVFSHGLIYIVLLYSITLYLIPKMKK